MRDSGAEQVEVSVIVPARNEEASLGRCLESLVQQAGVAFEIIVVNDHSTDRTREIAESFETDGRHCDPDLSVPHLPKSGRYGAPEDVVNDEIVSDPHLPKSGRYGAPRVRVIDAPELPRGWYGKSNACVAGSKLARGTWLLFTDADTLHKPGSLARAIAEAKGFKAELLSYSPEQEVHGIAERALMPVIFAELASTFRPRDVCNPQSPIAAANGQYLLITREAYDAVGGHAAVANDLLEDVALARRVKQSGRRLRFRVARDAVRTRMYRTWPQMREGWTKNLALLFGRPGRLAALRSLEFVASVGAFTAAVVAFAIGAHTTAVVLAIIAVPT